MINIPLQLKDCRFILINHKIDETDKLTYKRPMEKDWPYTNNYALTDQKFQKYMRNAQRYGVLGGKNNLIIIDFDTPETQAEVLAKKQLPETFTVKTAGKGLYHLYYFIDFPESFKAFDENGKTLFDVQGFSKYVIGPGSVMNDNKSYTIEKDVPIATIAHSKLLEVFKDYIKVSASKAALREKNLLVGETDVFIDDACAEIKKRLSITDALKEFGVDVSRNPTQCPLGHSSVHKASFSYEFDEEKVLWHCFSCNKAGDIITLYQEKFGWDFVKAKIVLMKKVGLEEVNAGVKDIDLTNPEYIDDKVYVLNMKLIAEKAFEKKQLTPLLQTQVSLLLNKRFIFVTRAETKVILFYDDKLGIFVLGGEQLIESELEKYLKHLMTKHICDETISRVRRMTYKSVHDFHTPKHMICLENGVYNFDTFELHEHDPKYMFMNYIHVKYDKNANCSQIDKFFGEIVESKYREFLYEIFAFTLLPNYIIQKAIILYGIGANGKSVYLELLRNFLGKENVSAEPLQKLVSNQFSTFQVYNKLANINADLSAQELNDNYTFKQLTSGKEALNAEQKFKDAFTFVNRAKLIFSCNQLPRSRDNSDAFFRRWCIVIFPFQFIGQADDKRLSDKLSTDEEMSGLFNKVIEKYKILRDLDDFVEYISVDDTRELYIKLSNPVNAFLDEVVVIDPMGFICKQELYKKYKEYCVSSKIPIIGIQEFFENVRHRFKVSEYIAVDESGKRVRAFRGIAWIDDVNSIVFEKKDFELSDF